MLLAQNETRPLIEFTLAPLWHDHGIPLAIMGILVVFLALSLLATFIGLLPRLLPRPATAPIAAEPTEAAGDEISEETLAVIAAAVAATLDRPHRIVRISGLTPQDLGWSLEGRLQHHQSHKIRHRGDR
ncbi:MAG: OadG family protein [Planctomycetales bacterium]|nr:OadG family protein [Planctomycetales bacterium]